MRVSVCDRFFSLLTRLTTWFIMRSPTPSSQKHKVTNRLKIYTKTGDQGATSLYTQRRVSKNDECFTALGDTDELNAQVGISRSHCPRSLSHLDQQLLQIQNTLFSIGAHLATPRTEANDRQLARTEFDPAATQQLESWIDELELSLSPLTNFILPYGSLLTTHLHLARAVCRRAERSVVPLIARSDADLVVLQYFNRLSDYLFVAARFATVQTNGTETKWQS